MPIKPNNPSEPPKDIELILASPPERTELVVQLFAKDGGQFGEVYRNEGRWLLEIYPLPNESMLFDANALCEAVAKSLGALKDRLE